MTRVSIVGILSSSWGNSSSPLLRKSYRDRFLSSIIASGSDVVKARSRWPPSYRSPHCSCRTTPFLSFSFYLYLCTPTAPEDSASSSRVAKLWDIPTTMGASIGGGVVSNTR